jgi:hypothetical protein
MYPILVRLASVALALTFAAARLESQETELKDETGKTSVRYVAVVPPGIAPAGTTDPAKQVGLFLCFQEHGRPTCDDIFPVRESLRRQGLSDSYILIAAHSQDPTAKWAPPTTSPSRN